MMTSSANATFPVADVAAAAHGVPNSADAAANEMVSPTVRAYRNRARPKTFPSIARLPSRRMVVAWTMPIETPDRSTKPSAAETKKRFPPVRM